jgi:hypothetical protein
MEKTTLRTAALANLLPRLRSRCGEQLPSSQFAETLLQHNHEARK